MPNKALGATGSSSSSSSSSNSITTNNNNNSIPTTTTTVATITTITTSTTTRTTATTTTIIPTGATTANATTTSTTTTTTTTTPATTGVAGGWAKAPTLIPGRKSRRRTFSGMLPVEASIAGVPCCCPCSTTASRWGQASIVTAGQPDSTKRWPLRGDSWPAKAQSLRKLEPGRNAWHGSIPEHAFGLRRSSRPSSPMLSCCTPSDKRGRAAGVRLPDLLRLKKWSSSLRRRRCRR